MGGKLTRVRLGEGLERSRTDWARVDALTDEAIAAAVRRDPDAVEARPAQGRVTVRLDADVLAWFRRQGRGYQTRLNLTVS